MKGYDWRRLYAVLALGLLGLGGCGPAEDAQTSLRDIHTGVYPAEDYIKQQAGKPGGRLRVAVSLDIGTFDLHAISSGNAQWIGRLLFDNLVYLDSEGNPSPWLAKSWTISEDGKTYTFKLREDVTFSDGTPFNAEAVLVNLEHMRDPATKSPLAAAYIAPYKGGRVLDEFTFEAQLSEAYEPFLQVLAQSWLALYSPKAIREQPDKLNEWPVGSGPFVLKQYQRQQGFELVRRDDYNWAPDFIGHQGPAYLQAIEVRFVPEALIRYSALSSGEFDLTLDAPAQNASNIRRNADLFFDVRIRKGNPSRTITFNTEKAPFDDQRVRQALAYAIDREGIARLSGFGEFKPKADFLAANTAFYDASFSHVLEQDLPRAERLLDDAGWSDWDEQGYRLRDGQRLSAEVFLPEALVSPVDTVAIQADAKLIGMELKIVAMPLQQYVQHRSDNSYQALATGVWHTNTPDGLYIQYHSDEITSARRIGQNLSRLRDERLDQWLTEARQSHDPELRQARYRLAQERLTELVPALPVYENYSLVAGSRKLQGVLFDTSHNTLLFTGLWLAE